MFNVHIITDPRLNTLRLLFPSAIEQHEVRLFHVRCGRLHDIASHTDECGTAAREYIEGRERRVV